jgi:GNAT superfamily N-acetyltransferase
MFGSSPSLTPTPSHRVNADGETAELTWIGGRPDFQRKGIGRRLVEAIEQELSRRGVKTLEVSTVASTVHYEPYALTRRFYHAIGFSDVRVEPKGFPSGDDKLPLRKQIELQGTIGNKEDE